MQLRPSSPGSDSQDNVSRHCPAVCKLFSLPLSQPSLRVDINWHVNTANARPYLLCTVPGLQSKVSPCSSRPSRSQTGRARLSPRTSASWWCSARKIRFLLHLWSAYRQKQRDVRYLNCLNVKFKTKLLPTKIFLVEAQNILECSTPMGWLSGEGPGVIVSKQNILLSPEKVHDGPEQIIDEPELSPSREGAQADQGWEEISISSRLIVLLSKWGDDEADVSVETCDIDIPRRGRATTLVRMLMSSHRLSWSWRWPVTAADTRSLSHTGLLTSHTPNIWSCDRLTKGFTRNIDKKLK